MPPRKNVSMRLLDQTYERLMPSNGALGEVDEWNRPVVSLALLDPNPEQPRIHFDPERLQELSESIRAHGVIQPLVVSAEPGGTYTL